MLRRLLILAVVLSGALGTLAPSASAMELIRSSTITLTGIVLPGRYIYIDSHGNLQKVIGNTSDNIPPTALDAQNQVVPLSGKVLSQYQKILADNNGYLQAGQTYYPAKFDPYSVFARWVTTNPYFSQKII